MFGDRFLLSQCMAIRLRRGCRHNLGLLGCVSHIVNIAIVIALCWELPVLYPPAIDDKLEEKLGIPWHGSLAGESGRGAREVQGLGPLEIDMNNKTSLARFFMEDWSIFALRNE